MAYNMDEAEELKPYLVEAPAEMSRRIDALKQQGKKIGLVPTMGALHLGHMSLAIAAKNECDVVVVSDFVNPTQFAPGEDYDKYPRMIDADLTLLSQIKTDYLFAPSPQAMYPNGFDAKVHVGGVTEILEGAFRPTHFDGVTTVVLKLFMLTRADVAYFGQKDYQQFCVIKKMVEDLNLPTMVEMCPIIREADGLAMSSRNRYLSDEERERALVLNRSLEEAERMIHSGERDVETIRKRMRAMILEADPNAQIDYIHFGNTQTLQEMERAVGNVVALLAVRIGSTRLIDNRIIRPKANA
ncbi:MAG: pantoate--beta-alanine ligase [Planctomycetia bacterium]|nr:pantoate--beta-alanine ligase [Planctomycetia bacterium]